MQANWELLVETMMGVREFLGCYGNGADFGDLGERVSYRTTAATHLVICRASEPVLNVFTGEMIDLSKGFPFQDLVAFREGYFHVEPPFDHVRFYVGQEVVILGRGSIRFEVAFYVDPDDWPRPVRLN